MKKMQLQNLAKCAVFFLLLAAILAVLSIAFKPKDNTKDAGMNFIQAHGFLGEPDNSIDVFFIGDSEAYGAYSPLEMWATSGFTAYVCANGSQSLDDTYTYLLEATQHQQPKLVIIEALPIMRKMSANDSLFSEAARLIPLLNDHDHWKTLRGTDLFAPVAYTHQDSAKGYWPRWKRVAAEDGQYMKATDQTKPIALLNRIYLARILDYCQKRGIQVLFVASPSPVNWNYKKHNAVDHYARKKGVPFLDLNLVTDGLEINNQTDWRDGGDHLNIYGATKVSRYLATYLAEEYDLPDHREDEAYSKWNDCLEQYREEYAAVFSS